MDLETGVRLADTQGLVKQDEVFQAPSVLLSKVRELEERAKPKRDIRET